LIAEYVKAANSVPDQGPGNVTVFGDVVVVAPGEDELEPEPAPELELPDPPDDGTAVPAGLRIRV
jgi:hypothetical protein